MFNRYGVTKNGIIHYIYEDKKAYCDLNIVCKQEVSKEYKEVNKHKFCKNCLNKALIQTVM